MFMKEGKWKGIVSYHINSIYFYLSFLIEFIGSAAFSILAHVCIGLTRISRFGLELSGIFYLRHNLIDLFFLGFLC